MCLWGGFEGLAKGKLCIECHRFGRIGKWLHEPFSLKECETCHGGNEAAGEVRNVDLSRVRWVLKRHFYGGRGFIFLPRRVRGKTLVFYSEAREKVQTLSLASAKPLTINTSNSPKILRASLCGWEKGVFVEAALCIETNVPTEVEVRIGNRSEHSGGDLYTRHKIVLTHLKEGKRYTATVIAKDLKGRKSTPYSCSFQLEGDNGEKEFFNSSGDSCKVSVVSLPSDDFALAIESDEEMDWRLGLLPEVEAQTERVKGHPLLSSALYASLDVCYECHPNEKLGASHPVNVSLKPGMKAKDVPLIGGVVTCVSCHEPHAANRPYLLRKKEDDLCVACHGERYRR